MALQIQMKCYHIPIKWLQISRTFLLLTFAIASQSWAQIISPTGKEVQFSVSAIMTASRDQGLSTKEQVQFHVSHLFGIFHSPTLISSYGLDPSLVDGIGAPQNEMEIKIISRNAISADKMRISYQATGKMILHKKVATQILAKKSLIIPLPVDPYEIYQEQCTDEHYSSFGDFWYFYDPYRPGCESLRAPPLAQNVVFNFRPMPRQKNEVTPRLDLLRGNNGNGDLFSIDVINGYSDSSTLPTDDGRFNFNQFNNFLKANGFERKTLYRNTTHPIFIFSKSVTLANGKTIKVQIRHILVETDISSRTISFAKFFKQAVESSDVIFYSGHSGLGMNIDIPLLEQKAGPFVFNQNKRQIFLFDSCSSYSYYLSTFSAQKTRARIDVVTNGLSSLFANGEFVLETFVNTLLDPKITDISWLEVLNRLEKPLDGYTSLINVGGI